MESALRSLCIGSDGLHALGIRTGLSKLDPAQLAQAHVLTLDAIEASGASLRPAGVAGSTDAEACAAALATRCDGDEVNGAALALHVRAAWRVVVATSPAADALATFVRICVPTLRVGAASAAHVAIIECISEASASATALGDVGDGAWQLAVAADLLAELAAESSASCAPHCLVVAALYRSAPTDALAQRVVAVVVELLRGAPNATHARRRDLVRFVLPHIFRRADVAIGAWDALRPLLADGSVSSAAAIVLLPLLVSSVLGDASAEAARVDALCVDATMWGSVRATLGSADAEVNKHGLHALQTLLDALRARGRAAGGGPDAAQLKQRWPTFIALHECLLEFNLHVVETLWPRVAELMPAAAALEEEEGETEGGSAAAAPLWHLDEGDLRILVERALRHDNPSVTRFALQYLVEQPCASRTSLARRLGSEFITNVTLEAVQSKSKAILQGLGGIELAASLGRFWTRYTRALSRTELHSFVVFYVNGITSLKSAGPLLTTCLAFLQRPFALDAEKDGGGKSVDNGTTTFAGALGAHEVTLLRGAIEHADLALPRFYKDETRRAALAALARFGERDALTFELIAALLETMPASFFSLRTTRGKAQYAMAQTFLLGPAGVARGGAKSASEWLTRSLARTMPLPGVAAASGVSVQGWVRVLCLHPALGGGGAEGGAGSDVCAELLAPLADALSRFSHAYSQWSTLVAAAELLCALLDANVACFPRAQAGGAAPRSPPLTVALAATVEGCFSELIAHAEARAYGVVDARSLGPGDKTAAEGATAARTTIGAVDLPYRSTCLRLIERAIELLRSTAAGGPGTVYRAVVRRVAERSAALLRGEKPKLAAGGATTEAAREATVTPLEKVGAVEVLRAVGRAGATPVTIVADGATVDALIAANCRRGSLPKTLIRLAVGHFSAKWAVLKAFSERPEAAAWPPATKAALYDAACDALECCSGDSLAAVIASLAPLVGAVCDLRDEAAEDDCIGLARVLRTAWAMLLESSETRSSWQIEDVSVWERESELADSFVALCLQSALLDGERSRAMVLGLVSDVVEQCCSHSRAPYVLHALALRMCTVFAALDTPEARAATIAFAPLLARLCIFGEPRDTLSQSIGTPVRLVVCTFMDTMVKRASSGTTEEAALVTPVLRALLNALLVDVLRTTYVWPYKPGDRTHAALVRVWQAVCIFSNTVSLADGWMDDVIEQLFQRLELLNLPSVRHYQEIFSINLIRREPGTYFKQRVLARLEEYDLSAQEASSMLIIGGSSALHVIDDALRAPLREAFLRATLPWLACTDGLIRILAQFFVATLVEAWEGDRVALAGGAAAVVPLAEQYPFLGACTAFLERNKKCRTMRHKIRIMYAYYSPCCVILSRTDAHPPH